MAGGGGRWGMEEEVEKKSVNFPRIQIQIHFISSSSSSSGRAISGIHESIIPSITVLQQSREVVWKAFRVSTELIDAVDCRATNRPFTMFR